MAKIYGDGAGVAEKYRNARDNQAGVVWRRHRVERNRKKKAHGFSKLWEISLEMTAATNTYHKAGENYMGAQHFHSCARSLFLSREGVK